VKAGGELWEKGVVAGKAPGVRKRAYLGEKVSLAERLTMWGLRNPVLLET